MTFAHDLADIALEQHAKFQFLNEHDDKLCKQIKRYWDETVGGFTSCTDVPWSAVFVSWCVKQAGATSTEFKFAAAHSVFVHDAINNTPRAFQGVKITAHAPQIGDIIQNNRGGTSHDFAFAKANKNYASHSAIVVEVGQDSAGRFALTVGGNESDAIRRTRVACDSNGLIKQKSTNPYICILKCEKV
ncbi:MAG TPA: DUF2272 domain-containing protein [Beijerinckiaceae bacterium]|jgi:hypothetical protein